ncbi:adenosylcobinamide-GDP ribazoletransferase [Clostridium polyendosporum]|uniref:Adenosylcobinamide-GDP ribazoletransferase n=1 Tax=Clostridium polyendosporum TaxID=69208 RepID=A0A919RXN7_9CLOT|nr:adenosylcobinamide-GDP ribazoletransferase [Clostridium polyendosporum]GIM28179.1 adenosylcobinamide-GDP ribazoletransferase [Clostridium polyendosporum]
MKNFILILQFMTRIPININLDVKREDFAEAVRYFPLVGLIIGCFDIIVYFLMSKIFPTTIASVFMVLSHVFITGGLHMDGLGDTADGMFSGRSRERILEIMKDSRAGSFGVLAVVIALLFRFGAFQSLQVQATVLYRGALLSPIIARTLVSMLMYRRTYAREKEGLGDLFIGKISRKTFITVLIMGIILTLFIGGYKGAISFGVVALFVLWLGRYVEKKIEGLTGDVLGASIELSEIIVLLCFTAKIGFL